MKFYNTLIPYKVIEYEGIQYTTCRQFDHISRYKGLRQVIHSPDNRDRFSSLEIPNSFSTHTDVIFYDVPADEENRLDVIAKRFLGSSNYSWVIAYFNEIEDGFTIREGQRLKIPTTMSSLFNTGEILAPISALQLNLGSE